MPGLERDAHPYMPNSAGRAQEEMLTEIGVKDIALMKSKGLEAEYNQLNEDYAKIINNKTKQKELF